MLVALAGAAFAWLGYSRARRKMQMSPTLKSEHTGRDEASAIVYGLWLLMTVRRQRQQRGVSPS
jgi:hypothetical protein